MDLQAEASLSEEVGGFISSVKHFDVPISPACHPANRGQHSASVDFISQADLSVSVGPLQDNTWPENGL